MSARFQNNQNLDLAAKFQQQKNQRLTPEPEGSEQTYLPRRAHCFGGVGMRNRPFFGHFVAPSPSVASLCVITCSSHHARQEGRHPLPSSSSDPDALTSIYPPARQNRFLRRLDRAACTYRGYLPGELIHIPSSLRAGRSLSGLRSYFHSSRLLLAPCFRRLTLRSAVT